MAKRSYEAIQSEIAQLQRLAKKLKKQRTAARQRARRKVFALMKKLGLTLDDLAAKPAPRAAAGRSAKSAAKAPAAAKSPKATKSPKVRERRTRKAPIKYRGPHRSDTWTGRGKTPRWLAALIATGRQREEFLVSK